jgi:hypothetical protein
MASSGAASATAPAPTELSWQISVDGPPPVAGTSVEFTAHLTSGGGPVSGEPAQLWVRPVGQSAFTLVAERTTDADGTVHGATLLARNSYTRWTFRGDSTYAASQSADMFQRVATRVGARVNDRSLAIGQRLVVRGRTFPAKPGHAVTLWFGSEPVPLLAGPRPKLLARAAVRADGSYRLATRFSTPGKRRLFVRVSGGGGNVTGYSHYRYARVG